MTLVGFLGLCALPLQAAINKQPKQILTEINRQYIALSWGDIWDKLRRKKGKRGSRGDEAKKLLCMITPGKLQDDDIPGTIKVWSDKPLFLWQGSMEGIEVGHHRSNELMWSQNLDATTNKITYQGKALQPGQNYFWRETVPLETLPTKVTFRIMEQPERDRISTELAELESKLRAEGASESKIALERVTYFADQQLWSDALREAYSIENPSGKLADFINKVEAKDFCPPEVSSY